MPTFATSLAGASALLAALALPAHADRRADWPMFGQNLQNTASAGERFGHAQDAARLKVKWTFTTGGDVSARAAVVGGIVYFPDWGGNLWAVDAETGARVWGGQLAAYGLTGSANGVYNSRTSPAVANGVLYLGTQEGAWLLAIDAATGALLWKLQLETADPLAVITAAPVVADGIVYAGVASLEEGAAANPAFPCCKARGSVVAVHARGRDRGAIKWKTYTVPVGYTGGAVWGSNFVVDAGRGSVFVGTGNNYAKPTAPAYLACVAGGQSAAACSSADDHVDSVLALDLASGKIKWAFRALAWNDPTAVNGTDDWNVACLVGFAPGQGNCPSAAGPDYDFGSAPNLVTYTGADGRQKTILGAGQKSGIYYALDPDTGAEVWHTKVGPGSTLGGMEWGSATDGTRIYVSIANLFGIPSTVGSAGSWAALDPATGKIVWQVADPNGAITVGPLTVADGVLYASSMAGDPAAPTMLGLDAATGRTIWNFAAGSSVNAGPAVVDGVLYWGAGYAHLGIPGFTGNNRFFAFSKGAR